MVESRRPKVGVVVGSGGLKSLGAIELIAMLIKEKIPITELFGSSGGSIICGFFGAFDSVEKVHEIIDYVTHVPGVMGQFDYSSIASMVGMPGISYQSTSSLLKPHLIIDSYRTILDGKKLESLPYKVTLQATDLNTGEEVRMLTGEVAEAMYVSGALQPFLPPRIFNGRLLGDGGYTNPVPIITAINAGMDIIIAIRFQEKKFESYDLFSVFDDFISKVVEKHRRLQMMLATDMPY